MSGKHGERGWQLAQLNIARALAPLDSPQLFDFMDNLDRINALADAAPGFVWRLQDEAGNATGIPLPGEAGEDPLLIVNLSVWESRAALFDYVYRSAHTPIMARRREWFERPSGPHMVLWWLPAGTTPGVEEAMERLDRLARDGPGPEAFTFKLHFPPPSDRGAGSAPPRAIAGEQPSCP